MLIQQIYLYLVCLVALVVGSIHVGILVYDVFEFAEPEVMLNSYHNTEPTATEYQNTIRHLYDKPGITVPTFEEYAQQRQLEYLNAVHRERRNATHSGLRAGITIVICSFLFWFHWRFRRQVEAD